MSVIPKNLQSPNGLIVPIAVSKSYIPDHPRLCRCAEIHNLVLSARSVGKRYGAKSPAVMGYMIAIIRLSADNDRDRFAFCRLEDDGKWRVRPRSMEYTLGVGDSEFEAIASAMDHRFLCGVCG